MANAVFCLLSEWCPLLLFLIHLVRDNGTGLQAQEVLLLSLCLLRRLRRGPTDTVLKYERTIVCTLLYSSKWHQDLPGQARSEDFGEGMFNKLVRDKAKNTGSVTVEEVKKPLLATTNWSRWQTGGCARGSQGTGTEDATTTNKTFSTQTCISLPKG